MADDFAKLWFQRSLNDLAITRAGQAIESQGRALPCRVTAVTGKIVTVEFEMDTSPWTLPPITIPKAESPWLTLPTQVGDYGVTQPADVYLGGVSGLGGGTSSFRRPGNLTALVFVPIGQKSFSPIDPNAAQLQGPNGAILRTTDGNASCVVNGSGVALNFGTTSLVLNNSGIEMSFAGQTIVLNGSGLLINGQSYQDHTHGYLPGDGAKVQSDPPIN
ncbi:hypothetical protein [Burkholderia gladioli]|uniref:hypothetical protein n=1 Tax=Burkholderia gladioli TaxID=28095 RepID=UPI000BBCFC0C|nr:hypothetical protein [Burkholderia gladioli]ATF87576.1 hypothetical protein CO712_20955 [Burkholderia gladioli pv. gladioli]